MRGPLFQHALRAADVRSLRRTARRFWTDDRGATSIEYAFIAGVLSLAVVAGARLIGGHLSVPFQIAGTALK